MTRRWLIPGALVVSLFSVGCFSVGTMYGKEQVVATTTQLNNSRAQLSSVKGQLNTADGQLNTVNAQLNAADAIVDVAGVKQIEVSYHWALVTKDIELMMSIFSDDGVFTAPDGTVYNGKAAIRAFFTTKAPAMQPQNQWAALVPNYRVQASVNGDTAALTFECHMVNIATNQMMVHHRIDMTLSRKGSQWVVKTMKATAIQLT